MKYPTIRHHTASMLTLLSCAIALCSCEKVVSIDLHNDGPQIVIEGIITDRSGPYTVALSKSGNYFEPSLYFPPVSHAFVIISDDVGNRDTLKEATGGTYRSSTLRGTVGRTYTLQVTAEGSGYTATSSMPQRVAIDSLYAVPRNESGGDIRYDLYVLFKDPPEEGNYYRLIAHVSNPQVPSDSIDGRRYRLFNDKLTNGNEAVFRIRIRRTVSVGDTVTIDLLSIDKATYDYFRTMNNILTSDRSPTSLSPANPNTNLSSGALGYFAAFTIDSKYIILK